MSKIVLTQKQFQEITKRLTEEKLLEQKETINEGYGDEFYEMDCDVEIDIPMVKYKGYDVEGFNTPKIPVRYYIGIEARSWGIKDIYIHGISGPTEYEFEVEYYVSGDDDNMGETKTETITLNNIDWENLVETEKETDMGVICVGKEISMSVNPKEDGTYTCTNILVKEYSL
jgi:hypothetical protein